MTFFSRSSSGGGKNTESLTNKKILMKKYSSQSCCQLSPIAVDRSALQDGASSCHAIFFFHFHHKSDWDLDCLLAWSSSWYAFPEEKLQHLFFCGKMHYHSEKLLQHKTLCFIDQMRKVSKISMYTCEPVEVTTAFSPGPLPDMQPQIINDWGDLMAWRNRAVTLKGSIRTVPDKSSGIISLADAVMWFVAEYHFHPISHTRWSLLFIPPKPRFLPLENIVKPENVTNNLWMWHTSETHTAWRSTSQKHFYHNTFVIIWNGFECFRDGHQMALISMVMGQINQFWSRFLLLAYVLSDFKMVTIDCLRHSQSWLGTTNMFLPLLDFLLEGVL